MLLCLIYALFHYFLSLVASDDVVKDLTVSFKNILTHLS